MSNYLTPVFVDINNDGDLDLFIGDRTGNIHFLQNTGTSTAATFAAPVMNPFGLSNQGDYASTSFVDLDGDGDQDAVIGTSTSGIKYFQNTGTASSPSFAAPVNNPYNLGGGAVGSKLSPVFADIDNDGDQDALIGNKVGNLQYYQNTGTSTAPNFTTLTANPFGLGAVGGGGWASPDFADLDGDGDLDLFVGRYTNTDSPVFFRNTGSASAPAFSAAITSPFNQAQQGDYSGSPDWVDIDADGDLDYFWGTYNPTIRYLQNTGAVNAAPTVGGITTTTTINDTATTTPFSGVTIADADANNVSVTVTLDTQAKGVLSSLGSFTDNGNGSYTLAATAAATAQTAIRQLVFNPTDNRVAVGSTEITTFTIAVNDGAATTTNATTTVTSTSVNDAPTVGGASAGQAVNDNATVSPFSAFTIADVDPSQTQTVSVTLDSASKGSFTTLSGFTDAGGGVYNFSGTAAAAQTAIRGLVFTPTANQVAVGSTVTTTFTVSVNDGVSTAVTNNTTTVVATSINDAPVNTKPAAQTFNEDGTLTFSAGNGNALSVADADTGTTLTTVVSVASGKGTLAVTTGGGGTITGDGSNSVQIVGTVAQVQNALGSVTYTPTANANGTGYATLTVSSTDGDTGTLNDTDTVTLNVSGIADTPAATNANTTSGTQTTSGLVLSRNAADSTEVSHFKITSITNGNLFQNDGTTAIANGDFITFAQGNAGLKFTPTGGGDGSFTAQASTSSGAGGLGGSTINATIAVGAAVASPTVNEDAATGAIAITLGGSETHYKITSISGGTLYSDAGFTATIASGDFISQGSGGGNGTTTNVYFRPTANANTTTGGNGSFVVQASSSNADGGLTGSQLTSTVTLTAVADTPSITNATTNEDVQSTSGLVISRNAVDGAETTHFKISSITGGTLYKADGTTAIANNAFITFAEGNAGLKFTPTANSNSNGSFNVEASTNGTTVAGSAATATVTVNTVADTPSVASPTITEDTDSAAIAITRNAADGAEMTHYKVTGISGGTLFSDAGFTTQITNGSFIASGGGTTNVYFRPTANSITAGNFTVQASTSNADGGLGGSTASSTVTITPIADTPAVTNANTTPATQTTSGLVLTRNAADSTEVTHFKITGITNGNLFKNDGTTAIADGAFITFAEGNAGLKFTPTGGGNGSFTAQASTSNGAGGLGGSTINATIAVGAAVASPTVNEDADSGAIAITLGGAESHYKITSISGGTLYSDAGYTTQITDGSFIASAGATTNVYFRPTANANTTTGGNGSFVVQASSSNADGGLTGAQLTSTVTLTAVADIPSVTNASARTGQQNSSGLVLSRNAADGAETTHFKITGITNGNLFKNDGTTAITNGTFITFAEGNAGLKFTPTGGGNGSFSAEASTNGTTVGGSAAMASILLDNTAPVFNAAGGTPADNATGVSTTADVVVVLGEALAAGSDLTKVYLKDVATDTLVPATFSLNGSGQLVINPNASLSNSTAYYVTWDANALKDAAGNAVSAVADETTFNFTTESAPTPAPAPSPTTPPTTITNPDGTTSTVIPAGSGNMTVSPPPPGSTVTNNGTGVVTVAGFGAGNGNITLSGSGNVTVDTNGLQPGNVLVINNTGTGTVEIGNLPDGVVVQLLGNGPVTLKDNDGASSSAENLAPGLGGSKLGDGNGDGTPDSLQSNVASVPFLNTNTAITNPLGATQSFVSLIADSKDGKIDTTDTTIATLRNVKQLDAPADRPADLKMPLGLISFESTINVAGGTETFSLYVDSTLGANAYLKKTSSGSWVNLASAEYGGQVVTVNGKTRLDFKITDGGMFDNDGKADGVITDPGAAGYIKSINPSDTDSDQFPDALEGANGLKVGLKDNDVFASNNYFVMQTYRDILFREAESAGLDHWKAKIDSGMSRAEVAASFLDSSEFQNSAGGISRLYFGGLDRMPDNQGMDHWVAEYQSGTSLNQISNAVVASNEFQSKYGTLDNAAFVNQLYLNVLGRSADSAGSSNWLHAMNTGASRGDILLGFTESAEYKVAISAEVSVTLNYIGLLDRTPDQAGFNGWVQAQDAGMPEVVVIGGFLGAQEYHDRFLP
jgi:hypothetical protein